MVGTRPDVVTVVRVPIVEIAEELRRRFKVGGEYLEVRLGDDSIEFHYSHDSVNGPLGLRQDPVQPPAGAASPLSPGRRRKARRRRNRMRTRGWEVVGKITNRRGQTAVIYKPFVEALSTEKLGRAAQRQKVGAILSSNGNRPAPGSIRYFLENTIDFLSKHPPGLPRPIEKGRVA